MQDISEGKLRLEWRHSGERCIVAAADFAAGDVLFVEEPLCSIQKKDSKMEFRGQHL